MGHPTVDKKAYWALAFICLVWGTTYLVLRIGVMHFPPFLFTGLRQVTAGLLLGSFMVGIRREQLGGWKNIGRQAIAGTLMICMGNGLVGWAEMYVPSGIAALLCSLMPVWVILINLGVSKEEPFNWMIGLGASLGVVGMLLVFRDNLTDLQNPNYAAGIGLIFTAVIAWAGGSIYIKRQPRLSHPIMNASLQMFFGGVGALICSTFIDRYQELDWSKEVLFSLGYLIVFGSIAAFAAFSYALSKLPTAVVSLYAYINPLVALVLGWAILGEKLNAAIGLAFLLTASGIYLVNRGYQQRPIKVRFWRAAVKRA